MTDKSFLAYLAERTASTTGVSMVPGLNGAGDAVEDVSAFLFKQGNQTSVAGSKMKIEKLIEDSDDWPLENEGSIWTGKTFTYTGISKTFDASYDGGAGPITGLFVFVNNDGATGDIVAVLGDAVARQDGGTVFGFNFIARNHTGVEAKLVGGEIDYEPYGVTPLAGSGALYINCFSLPSPGCFIQTGELGGGSMANGIVLHGVASTGAGLAAQAGTTMGALVHSGIATYSLGAAFILSNLHKVRFSGTALAHAFMFNDASNNLRIIAGSTNSVFIRNNADTTSLFSFQAGGVGLAAAWDVTTEYRANGTKILGGARGSALPADATDLATAITLVNTIKSRFSAAGTAEHPLFA